MTNTLTINKNIIIYNHHIKKITNGKTYSITIFHYKLYYRIYHHRFMDEEYQISATATTSITTTT